MPCAVRRQRSARDRASDARGVHVFCEREHAGHRPARHRSRLSVSMQHATRNVNHATRNSKRVQRTAWVEQHATHNKQQQRAACNIHVHERCPNMKSESCNNVDATCNLKDATCDKHATCIVRRMQHVQYHAASSKPWHSLGVCIGSALPLRTVGPFVRSFAERPREGTESADRLSHSPVSSVARPVWCRPTDPTGSTRRRPHYSLAVPRL